jgi:hypothetical protein
MFFPSTTCRIVLVLAAACNAVTSAKEAEVELSEDHHRALRGSSPNTPTTTAATTVESLADPHSRMLGSSTGFSVQAGAAVVFTHPPTVIHGGDVCAFGAVTGDYGFDYVFTNDADTAIAPAPEDSASNLVTSAHCDPMAKDGTQADGSKSLFYLLKDKLALPLLADATLTAAQNAVRYTVIDAEIGGQTFYPGIYFASSLTMAANTQVTLKGSGNFQFISGSTMVTSANTEVLLVENLDATSVGTEGYGKPAGTPTSHQIEWDVTLAATLGALSEVKGSILAGAAITLGAAAKVSGCILALAGVTLGMECDVNEDKVDSPSY